jgi:hypothetical protein
MDRDLLHGVRFAFAFGELERVQDPLGSRTFQPAYPRRIDERHTPGFLVREVGLHRYASERAAVVTPGGRATSFSGPEQDTAFMVAMPVPASTRARKFGAKG